MTEQEWRYVFDEKLGPYECRVVKRASGSNVTYEWYDADYGIKRQTISFSTRPLRVYHANGTYPNGDYPYVRRRGVRLRLDDFVMVAPVMLGKRCFNYAMSETAFSGYMLDSQEYVESDGEYAYIARQWS